VGRPIGFQVRVNVMVPDHTQVAQVPDTSTVLDLIAETTAHMRKATTPQQMMRGFEQLMVICLAETKAIKLRPERLLAPDAKVCGRCKHWQRPVPLAMPGPGNKTMTPDHGGCAIDRRSKCKVRSGGCDDFEQ